MTTSAISILVVDDTPDMRLLARLTIERDRDFTIVGTVASGEEALEEVERLQPDVVLLDQMMPGLTGTQTAALIHKRHPDVRLVLWTSYLNDDVRAEAEWAGVSRCLNKAELQLLPQILRCGAA